MNALPTIFFPQRLAIFEHEPAIKRRTEMNPRWKRRHEFLSAHTRWSICEAYLRDVQAGHSACLTDAGSRDAVSEVGLFFLGELGDDAFCAGVCCGPGGGCGAIAASFLRKLVDGQETCCRRLTAWIHRRTQAIQWHLGFIRVTLRSGEAGVARRYAQRESREVLHPTQYISLHIQKGRRRRYTLKNLTKEKKKIKYAAEDL